MYYYNILDSMPQVCYTVDDDTVQEYVCALAGQKFSAKKQKNQQRARGSRVTGDGALLRRGMTERNRKTILRCNKGLSPVTRNT